MVCELRKSVCEMGPLVCELRNSVCELGPLVCELRNSVCELAPLVVNLPIGFLVAGVGLCVLIIGLSDEDLGLGIGHTYCVGYDCVVVFVVAECD